MWSPPSPFTHCNHVYVLPRTGQFNAGASFPPTGAGGGDGGQASGTEERSSTATAQEPGVGGTEDQLASGAVHLQVGSNFLVLQSLLEQPQLAL